MYKRLRYSEYRNLDYILIDLLCLQVSFVISYTLRHGMLSPYTNPIYQLIGILLVLLHIIIVLFTEFYNGMLKRGKLDELKSIIKYNCILLAAVLGYMFIAKQSAAYSRQMFLVFWCINIVIMYVVHVLEKQYINSLRTDENNGEYIVLITNKNLAQKSIEKFISSENNTLKLRGIIIIDEDMTGREFSGVSVVANYDTMMEYARTNVVDQVFININTKKIEEITSQFMDMGITVHINIDHISSNLLNFEVQNVGGSTVLTTSINIVSPRQMLIKRLISIIAGIIGLIATAVAYVIFAPIIYIQSPGPILFSQERIGKNGRRFRILKFRTMYIDAEERKKELLSKNKMNGLLFKIDNDPRVTPIGKFLRESSIDELPQFWNILKGDMSLVGTRPPTVDEYEKYGLHHKQRLAVDPGLTGMWQVSGRSNIIDFEEVVKLDTEYIKNWSLGLDMKIILKTVRVVLDKKGAV